MRRFKRLRRTSESAEIWTRVRAMLNGLASERAPEPEVSAPQNAAPEETAAASEGVELDARLERQFVEGWRRCAIHNVSLTVVAFEIDTFEAIQDAIGPDAAQRCVAAIEKTINAKLPRDVSACARWGHCGFVLVLPDHPLLMARATAKAITSAVQAMTLPARTSHAGAMTLATGIACTNPHGEISRTVLDAAVSALAGARKLGVGRLEISDLRRPRRRAA